MPTCPPDPFEPQMRVRLRVNSFDFLPQPFLIASYINEGQSLSPCSSPVAQLHLQALQSATAVRVCRLSFIHSILILYHLPLSRLHVSLKFLTCYPGSRSPRRVSPFRIQCTYRRTIFKHSVRDPIQAVALRQAASLLQAHPCVKTHAWSISEFEVLWHAMLVQFCAPLPQHGALYLLRRQYRNHSWTWSVHQKHYFFAALRTAELFALCDIRAENLSWPSFKQTAADYQARPLHAELWYRNAPFMLPSDFSFESIAFACHLRPLLQSQAWRTEHWSLSEMEVSCPTCYANFSFVYFQQIFFVFFSFP